MGGSGQFVWDLSFSGATLSLLDPESVEPILTSLNANGNFTNYPISLAQMWDAYKPYPNIIGAGQYCFDYIATFLFYHSYITTNKDGADFLRQPVQNNHYDDQQHTGIDFLRRIVWNFQSYDHPDESDYLADYGSDKRRFLEAVPTYVVRASEQNRGAKRRVLLQRFTPRLSLSVPLSLLRLWWARCSKGDHSLR